MGFWAKTMLASAKRNIKRAIKDERLKFISEDKISYTDKNGKTDEYSFEGMAILIQDKTGKREEMVAYFGITDNDILDILKEEYEKTMANSFGLISHPITCMGPS